MLHYICSSHPPSLVPLHSSSELFNTTHPNPYLISQPSLQVGKAQRCIHNSRLNPIAEQFHPAELLDKAQLRVLSTVSRGWNAEAECVLYCYIIGVTNAMLHLHFFESMGLRGWALLVQTYQADFTFWNRVVLTNLYRVRTLRSFNNLKALEFVNSDSQFVCFEDCLFQLEKFDWQDYHSQYVHHLLTGTQTQLEHLT